jgi:ferric iron reductase protein FhuF
MIVSGSAALRDARALGPFSAADEVPGRGWVSWAALIEDPEILQSRVAEVRDVLAAGAGSPGVQPRVAASLAHLGLVARLVAPLLGAALVARVLPVTSSRQVHLRPVGSNPLPLAFTGVTAAPVSDAGSLAHALTRSWLEPVVGPLTDAVHNRFRISRRVLEGNVVSAVAGALGAAGTARPDLAAAADDVLTAVLTAGPLSGTGRRRAADGSFIRHSCCLFYRLPGAGTCGDCVLRRTG